MTDMEFRGLNIKIFTRSINRNLYDLSGKTINLPFERIRVKNTTADEYFSVIVSSGVDIAINIDEDAFILSNTGILDLLKYMLNNNYTNCGMPDGGVVPIRFHNPLITNAFFNILDVRRIKEKIAKSNLDNYRMFKDSYIKNCPTHIIRTEFCYDMFEPYYPFFLWISQNFKVLYLDAYTHQDKISTILLDHKNQPLLVHSWYSRLYGEDKFHTLRINSLLNECGIKVFKKGTNKLERIENFLYLKFTRRIKKLLTMIGFLGKKWS